MAFNNIWWIVQTACCLLATSQAQTETAFAFRRALSSGLPMANAAAILENVRSSLDCARMCFRPACCSYGYNRKSRQCRLYAGSYDTITEVDSFAYFLGCAVVEMSPPTFPEDVTAATAGPNNYNCSYTEYNDHAIWGYNLYYNFWWESETDCKSRCCSNYQCKSLEYKTGECYLNYRTKDEAGGSYGYVRGWRYYEKSQA